MCSLGLNMDEGGGTWTKGGGIIL